MTSCGFSSDAEDDEQLEDEAASENQTRQRWASSWLFPSCKISCRVIVPRVHRLNQRSSLLLVDPHGRQGRHLEARSGTLCIFSTTLRSLTLGRLQKSPGGIRFASIRGRKYPASRNYNRHSEEKRSEVSLVHCSPHGLLLTYARRRIHTPGSGSLNSPANRKKTRVKAPL